MHHLALSSLLAARVSELCANPATWIFSTVLMRVNFFQTIAINHVLSNVDVYDNCKKQLRPLVPTLYKQYLGEIFLESC